MMNDAKRFLPLLGWVAAALAASCSADPCVGPQPEAPAGEKVEVRIAASQLSSTRTLIEENGEVTRWNPGDRIALWALPEGGGNFALEAKPFSLYYFDDTYSTAWFTASLDPMAAGTYAYYAAYPVPAAVSGSVAEYELPSTQTGSADMSHAVMVGRPVTGGSLTTVGAEKPKFSFVHKLHVLKIHVPENKNLLGKPVTRLEVDFFQPVTGRLSVDVSDVDAPVALDGNSASSVLTLDFPAPIDVGSTVYAVIAPVDLTGGTINFKAYSESLESNTVTTSGKVFAAGRTTPILLTIPPQLNRTKFCFTIGPNHLGEAPENFTVRFTDGTAFPGGESEVRFTAADADAEGRYTYAYTGDFETDYSHKEFEVTFESAHAIVRKTFTMPAVERYALTNVAPLEVPYLYFEDFSRMTGTFDNMSNFSNSDTANASAISLDQYGLNGWAGARIGGMAATNIRIASRVEMGLWIQNIMNGRVDSEPLWNEQTGTGIKSGGAVKIQVTYDYAGDLYEGSGSGGFPVYSAGCTKTLVAHGKDGIERIASNVNGVVLKPADGNSNNNAIYGLTPYTETYTMDNCDGGTRLSWSVTNNRKAGFGGNGQYWLYIDNIRVSIAQ